MSIHFSSIHVRIFYFHKHLQHLSSNHISIMVFFVLAHWLLQCDIGIQTRSIFVDEYERNIPVSHRSLLYVRVLYVQICILCNVEIAIHIACLCAAMVVQSLIADDWVNGWLLLSPPLIWVIDLCIFVVVEATLRRKLQNYAFSGQQSIDMQQYDDKATERTETSAPAPRRLSLRLNTQAITDEQLMMYAQEGDQTMTGNEVVHIRHTPEAIRYKQMRHVTCCCSKFICSLRTCLQIQTGATAAFIWGSFGLFLLNKISWTPYVLLLFVAATTVWNPICYSKRCWLIRNSKRCCSIGKCCMFLAYCFGIIVVFITVCICSILFIVANPFEVGSVDETAAVNLSDQAGTTEIFDFTQNENKLLMMYTIWAIAGLSFLNYLPGAGWVFYQVYLRRHSQISYQQ